MVVGTDANRILIGSHSDGRNVIYNFEHVTALMRLTSRRIAPRILKSFTLRGNALETLFPIAFLK